MSDIALFTEENGKTRIVNAEEALHISKEQQDFRCVGRNPRGVICGCKMYPVNANEKRDAHFRCYPDDVHIKGCSNNRRKDISVFIENIDLLDIEKFIAEKRAVTTTIGPTTKGYNPGPDVKNPKPEDEDEVELIDKDKIPVSVKVLYTALINLPFDLAFSTSHLKVGEVLVRDDTVSEEWCTTLEGFKVFTVKRCIPPKHIDRSKEQIITELCCDAFPESQYLVLNIPDEKIRTKAWDLLQRDKKILNGATPVNYPRVIVAGKVSHRNENVWICDILNSKMIARVD